MLLALTRVLINERERALRRSAAAGSPPISLDDTEGLGRYRLEPADELTAVQIYERRRTAALLDQVMLGLRRENACGPAGRNDSSP